MGKIDELMVRGALVGTGGLFLYADAIGCGKVYGYGSGSVFEFVLGTLAVVAGAWQVYLAGRMRDRLARAEFERRRMAREERLRERLSR